MNKEIIPGEWVNAYYFWVSERGSPIRVKPLRYIGLKGWNNYIYKKEYEDCTYCGEIWLCEDIFGEEKEYIFRVIHTDDIEERKYKQKFKFTYKYIGAQLVEINAHTDGFDAYIEKDFQKRYKYLLQKVNERHHNKKELLSKWFKELNNIENRILKLGVQLYLRRLETPTMQTSREWKEWGQTHPYLKSQIISRLKETGSMT